MLDSGFLRENLADVRARLSTRGASTVSAVLDRLADLDKQRRAILPLLEQMRRERKALG